MKPKAMTKAERLERLESMTGLFKNLTPEQQENILNEMMKNLEDSRKKVEVNGNI